MKLELRNIKKNFGEKEILHGINFSVESGKALGLLGRNGAGKTTTIRIIMDVFHSSSGEVLLDGKKLIPSGNRFGYLPEERGMYPKKLVKEQLVYMALLRGMKKKDATISAEKWLDRLGVSEYKDRKLDTLSKGNQQKVQLAATLVGEPDIVILDEPFSGLDPVNSQILKDVIKELIAEGRIVIFSSHQMSYVEEFCEDIVMIDKGIIVLSGNLDEIKEEFGKGRKIISANNMDADALKTLIENDFDDLVKVISSDNHKVIVEVKAGVDQWSLVDRLKEKNIDIKAYGNYEPSLTDIFIDKAGEAEEEIKDDNKNNKEEE